jgi:hypothetical protein
VLAGCSGPHPWSLNNRGYLPVDQQPLSEDPKERDPSLYWDAVNQSSFYLIEQSLDFSRQYRKLFDRQKEAYNADVFGNIAACSWFTNRHATERMTLEALQRGPRRIDGPDLSGPWTITRAKTQGVTPGFFVRDAQGETFVVKFDPVVHPELATGAEMISTSFFYAAGYFVPENYLVTFDPSILTIKDGLEFKDRHGEKRPFTQDVLDEVLGKVAVRPDGRIRAIASRLLKGQPLGPFSYHGRRKDDPNDHLPHQHRRELRGLKVLASLVNHFDTKDHNTLDMLVEEDGARYVRHHLIDFGSTLGSDGNEPKDIYRGYAYVIDLEQALVSLATLGLRQWSWEGASAEGIPPSVGYFESERFTAPGWKPLHANPAFDNMTANDAYWATRIVAAYTEADLQACIDAAEFSDPEAGPYLLNALIERRRKIIDYYYSKVNPLDGFRLDIEDSALALSFEDRWVLDGAGTADQVAHRYRIGHGEKSWGSYQPLDGSTPIVLDAATMARMRQVTADATTDNDRVFNVQIQSRRNGKRGHWVKAYIYFNGDLTQTRLVGVERDS